MWNPDQLDGDKDGVGNACDNCRNTANMDQKDTDNDTVGDVCDNAPTIPNRDQADADRDAIPDVLDPDDDNDGVLDGSDNCRTHANPKQEDTNGNGIGDACESRLVPDKDIYAVFIARDKYFERFQILVDPWCSRVWSARRALEVDDPRRGSRVRAGAASFILDGGLAARAGSRGEPRFEATVGGGGRAGGCAWKPCRRRSSSALEGPGARVSDAGRRRPSARSSDPQHNTTGRSGPRGPLLRSAGRSAQPASRSSNRTRLLSVA